MLLRDLLQQAGEARGEGLPDLAAWRRNAETAPLHCAAAQPPGAAWFGRIHAKQALLALRGAQRALHA